MLSNTLTAVAIYKWCSWVKDAEIRFPTTSEAKMLKKLFVQPDRKTVFGSRPNRNFYGDHSCTVGASA